MNTSIENGHPFPITAGLSCDGDTIAVTAATQPSIEDMIHGIIPGIPKVRFHNPVLSYEVGEDFMQFLYDAAEDRMGPFILVIEGSIPNEKNKTEGSWAAFGLDRVTGEPIPTCEWIDPGWRPKLGPWSPRALARPTAASTPWPVIPPAGHGALRLSRLRLEI